MTFKLVFFGGGGVILVEFHVLFLGVAISLRAPAAGDAVYADHIRLLVLLPFECDRALFVVLGLLLLHLFESLKHIKLVTNLVLLINFLPKFIE